jgi:hypothetical protein
MRTHYTTCIVAKCSLSADSECKQTNWRTISGLLHISGGKQMADRKQFMEIKEADAELLRLLKDSENVSVTDEQLREQRISFAFGNALNSDSITKESVRHTSRHVRLLA